MTHVQKLADGMHGFMSDGRFRVFIHQGETYLIFDTNCYNEGAPAPLYEHDCDNCVYLGRFENEEGNRFNIRRVKYDIYFCPNEPTVIARYGDDGPAYTSGLSSDHPAIQVGISWSRKIGLLK